MTLLKLMIKELFEIMREMIDEFVHHDCNVELGLSVLEMMG